MSPAARDCPRGWRWVEARWSLRGQVYDDLHYEWRPIDLGEVTADW